MTTFVLVHGAWHGPWAWEKVTPFLHRTGARTIVPQLREGDVGLREHVDDVITALDTASGEVVLVGHSYAGLVVREAADAHPDKVAHVVLVDGWAGPDGSSLFTLAPDFFVEVVRAWSDGTYIPAPPPDAFGITDPDEAALLVPRLRPQPLRTFTDATRLTGAVDRIPGTAVYCRPQTYPFDRFGKELGYRTLGTDGPHDLMVTHPEQVARLLLDVAEP
ncbi:alpha/beta fold hydrolase [Actinomadura livida]|uniref:Alpha/beta fold hydrolase n=1 Tax=Actinomadura livida TaxID=79909 RepID=A0A7W7I9J9_9ACTN|nr:MULTISPECIES: alpha/beta fold hydrolase [Actinomadura]MBB4772949.1 pimeloyl-ACP methyl ester carboxylesterase [Actinomadura catellatispora]GGU13860.1 esterase [Actinomadura livida]